MVGSWGVGLEEGMLTVWEAAGGEESFLRRQSMIRAIKTAIPRYPIPHYYTRRISWPLLMTSGLHFGKFIFNQHSLKLEAHGSRKTYLIVIDFEFRARIFSTMHDTVYLQ